MFERQAKGEDRLQGFCVRCEIEFGELGEEAEKVEEGWVGGYVEWGEMRGVGGGGGEGKVQAPGVGGDFLEGGEVERGERAGGVVEGVEEAR